MPRPSTPLLSREAIISRALRVIDAEGVGALSVRRLASDLGVRAPSLYHHFANKDEILDSIVDLIYAQIRLADAGTSWEKILTTYAHQLRAALTAHPHVVEFMALRPVTRDAGLCIYEQMISRLSACGWSTAFSRELTLAVENLVFGAALMANAPDIELTAEQRTSYPHLAALAISAPRNAPDDGFDVGFSLLISGLRQLPEERQ